MMGFSFHLFECKPVSSVMGSALQRRMKFKTSFLNETYGTYFNIQKLHCHFNSMYNYGILCSEHIRVCPVDEPTI